MTNELKSAQSQRSDIREDHYGYLPLIIPDVEFLTLPNNAVVVYPLAPSAFTVMANMTAVQSVMVKS